MKKNKETEKELLIALLDNFTSTNDLMNVYKSDGSILMTVEDAKTLVEGMKDTATPEQIEFESSLDTLLHEFEDHFPKLGGPRSSFYELFYIWRNRVRVDLRSKYNNL
jgi:hypothetical protein